MSLLVLVRVSVSIRAARVVMHLPTLRLGGCIPFPLSLYPAVLMTYWSFFRFPFEEKSEAKKSKRKQTPSFCVHTVKATAKLATLKQHLSSRQVSGRNGEIVMMTAHQMRGNCQGNLLLTTRESNRTGNAVGNVSCTTARWLCHLLP